MRYVKKNSEAIAVQFKSDGVFNGQNFKKGCWLIIEDGGNQYVLTDDQFKNTFDHKVNKLPDFVNPYKPYQGVPAQPVTIPTKDWWTYSQVTCQNK